MPRRTRSTLVAALLPTLALLPACSLRPSFEVRVENLSSSTVVAQLVRDRTLDGDEILAQARIRPDAAATLGPASADPLDPVHLRLARPEDLQSLPDNHKLSRGRWIATVTDAPITTWHRFAVSIEKDTSERPADPAE